MNAKVARADITHQLRGKRFAYAESNGQVFRLVFEDGSRLDVVQLDETGTPHRGQFVARAQGPVIRAERFDELMNLAPAARA